VHENFLPIIFYTVTKFQRSWSKNKPQPSMLWSKENTLLLQQWTIFLVVILYKKAQLSLTNRTTRKACQKLLQFDVLTTLSLTILAYLYAFSCYCVRNLRNPEKFTENSNLWSSRSSKVIGLGANLKTICDLLLVINSNFSRICYCFLDIITVKDRKLLILLTCPFFDAP